MEIVLRVNGSEIDRIEVQNMGPPAGYVAGDWPGGGGERAYRWSVNARYGFVRHNRRDGARALAAKVLEATK